MTARAALARLAATAVAAVWAGGCAAERTVTFDIDVRNATADPVTISLAKDGRPTVYEPAWVTPEDIAIETVRERGGMKVVGPGQVAYVRGLTGRFGPGSRPALRAYAGDLTISEMCARSRGDPGRADVPLAAGFNAVTVRRRPDGSFAADVSGPNHGPAAGAVDPDTAGPNWSGR